MCKAHCSQRHWHFGSNSKIFTEPTMIVLSDYVMTKAMNRMHNVNVYKKNQLHLHTIKFYVTAEHILNSQHNRLDFEALLKGIIGCFKILYSTKFSPGKYWWVWHLPIVICQSFSMYCSKYRLSKRPSQYFPHQTSEWNQFINISPSKFCTIW